MRPAGPGRMISGISDPFLRPNSLFLRSTMAGRYAFLSWRIIDQFTQDNYIAGATPLAALLAQGSALEARQKRGPAGVLAMRLSTKGRYAVMAMADLAGHQNGARPV